MTVTHVAPADQAIPVCGNAQPGEPVIPWVEAMDEHGRHFNCVDCHRALTGGERHAGDGGQR